MESRLLPQPVEDVRDSEHEVLAASYARRESDNSSPKVKKPNSEPASSAQTIEPTIQTKTTRPQVSVRPTGRLSVALILLFCVGSVCLFLWNTFFRDAAYGVVAGRVTALSAPWSGTLSAVFVSAGETVQQGDVLAIVADAEIQASIDRLSDDMRTAQAELDALAAQLALAARKRSNDAEEIRANYFDLRGQLLAEQSRHDELTSRLQRRQALANTRAYSQEEIESLRFDQEGLAAKIENLEQAALALETRLKEEQAAEYETAQLRPILTKIETAEAEIRRLRERQLQGTLRAPFSGTIVEVDGRVGERTSPDRSLLEFLPENSIELVLYVNQSDADRYRVGHSLDVVVEPLDEPIACEIARVGRRLEKPDSYVPGRYRPEEKLLPVYLRPIEDSLERSEIKVGGTIRLPARLFGP